MGRGTAENPIREWSTADPDSVGLNLDALERHRALCEDSEASGCLVAYRGEIVQEWYADSFPSDPIAMQPWIGTRSAAKSVFGLVAGMLVADGAIGSIDEPVATFIPEWRAGAEAGVTIRHLLTMTSGVARHAGEGRHPGVVAARNLNAFVFELPLQDGPGERWNYSNEGAQLLSPVLERAAGMPLAAYTWERLFNPLGLQTSFLRVDDYYNTVTIGGMMTRLREFARLGQLVANDGAWNGEQIVSSDWIRDMTTGIEQNPAYGYLWWVSEEHGAFAAAGSFDQLLVVIPDLDLVAVRLQRDVESGRTGYYWGTDTYALLREIVEGGWE
jgi:CubicO group peptidase (beta-lactamase class C family)